MFGQWNVSGSEVFAISSAEALRLELDPSFCCLSFLFAWKPAMPHRRAILAAKLPEWWGCGTEPLIIRNRQEARAIIKPCFNYQDSQVTHHSL